MAIGMTTDGHDAPSSRIAACVLARSGPDMAGEVRRRAVLLDAMGTLLTFADPAPRLRAGLNERLGIDVGEAAARAAIRAEIAHYRAHLHRGRDARSLAALRAECAEAMRPALGPAAGAPGTVLTAALLDALAFVAYPDSAPALRALRADGHALVVVSNWDVSLHERLQETGLAELVDGAVASAVLGAAKPDGAIFARGLALAGADAADAWHVGDDVVADIEGALAAGIRPVLIARDGEPPELDGVPVIRGLAELPALIKRDSPSLS
jgi:putative hydrolase of the HAD superfamily